MNNDLNLIDKIIYGNLMPWLDENKPDAKFVALVNEVKKITPEYTAKFELDFYRPFNQKTKYYNKLIFNEVTAYCNKIKKLIHEDNNSKLQKYWQNDTLNKKLPSRLKDLGKLIKDKQFELDYINPRKSSLDLDANHKTDTYIIQLLKLSLIRIYLEIQDFFPFLSEDDKLIDEDFYTQFLFEPIPEMKFIKVTQPIIEISVQIPQKEKQTSQEAKNYESFKYKQYNKNPDKLTDLCDSLRKGNFIHQDTKATDFKKLFSGNNIENPVIWIGNRSEFAYFIKLIHNKHKLVEDLKQDQWKIAIQCFVKEGSDSFEIKDRKLQRPNSTGDKLDRAVCLLF
jgi:hypothetical protein